MEEIFSWLVDAFGIWSLTLFVISFYSTITERLILFFVCLSLLGASFFLARLLPFRILQLLLPVLASFAIFFGLYIAFPFDEYPFAMEGHYPFPGNRPILVALSLSLIIAVDRSRLWLRRGQEGGKKARGPMPSWLPAAAMASGLAILLLNGFSLRGLARALHADPAVQQFAIGDFNGLKIDGGRGRLFANGHGTNYLLAYNVNALNQAPSRSQVEVGRAKSFAYNPRDQELYVLEHEQVTEGEKPPTDGLAPETKTLRVLDATTLALKRNIPGLRVGSGDTEINWDSHRDYIIVNSEQPDDGFPVVIIDRITGRILHTIDLLCNNSFLHPRKPLFYMTHDYKLVAFNIELLQVVATYDPQRKKVLQRMDMTSDERELLVAAPLESAILRLDAETLELKSSLRTVRSVRTLAVDPIRNLLLTGSFISNMLEVIDLRTNKSIAMHYVGPWLRTIVVDSARGVAYVSSIEGLFKVDYARPNSQ